MRTRATLVVPAILAAGLMLTPSSGALEFGCERVTEVTTLPAGQSTTLTPPGADVLGWTPECIIVENGQTVTFTQRDVEPHGVETGCFQLGIMDALSLPSTTLKLDYDHATSLFFMQKNGASNRCSSYAVVGHGSITIEYWCEVHGSEMPGKIIVEL